MVPNFSDLAAQVQQFIESCHLDRVDSALQADQRYDRLGLELFALQFRANEPYRKFCRFHETTPDCVKHWSQIPAVPTTSFKELEFTSLPPNARTRAFESSGTTAAVRSRHYHSAESLALYETSLLPWFKSHLLADRDRIGVVSLTPPGQAAPNSSLVHMFETIQRQFGNAETLFAGEVTPDGAWIVDTKLLVEHLQRACAEKQPVLLLGTAFNYVQVLDVLLEARLRLRLPPGSRLLETGGYKGRSKAISKGEFHTLLSEHFGLDAASIVGEYGMSELSSQAYDRVAGQLANQRLFQFPPWARAQIVSPETGRPVGDGQTGLIRVFDLANVWSVMAIQTEDLAIVRRDGFELLGRSGAVDPRGCSLMTVSE